MILQKYDLVVKIMKCRPDLTSEFLMEKPMTDLTESADCAEAGEPLPWEPEYNPAWRYIRSRMNAADLNQ